MSSSLLAQGIYIFHIPTYKPLKKITAIKNETLGTELLEMTLEEVTDPQSYPRCWWHDPFPSAPHAPQRGQGGALF